MLNAQTKQNTASFKALEHSSETQPHHKVARLSKSISQTTKPENLLSKRTLYHGPGLVRRSDTVPTQLPWEGRYLAGGGMETLVIVSERSPKPSCERDPCAESRGRTRGQDAPSVLGPRSARGSAVGSPQGLPGPASDRFTFGKNSWKFGG